MRAKPSYAVWTYGLVLTCAVWAPELRAGPVRAINCGGSAVGDFQADYNYSGGNVYQTSHSIAGGSAPQYVYQTERNSVSPLTYKFGVLTPRGNYSVRLHFAEIYWSGAGQRLFDVSINGVQVLDDYDIYVAAGGQYRGVQESFTAYADTQGWIIITFTTEKDRAKCSGIEIDGAPTSLEPLLWAEVEPPFPTAQDEVSIALGGMWNNSCLPNRFDVSIVGCDIYIDVNAQYPEGTMCLQAFMPWKGSVSAGRLLPDTYLVYASARGSPYKLMTQFTVEPASGMITAWYVDDDALLDPGPGDPCVSDPAENGSSLHPFDRIQEAIDTAQDGQTVVVLPGVYRETINFLGKSICVSGAGTRGPEGRTIPYPVIDGNDQGTAVTFAGNEHPSTLLSGFVITRGRGVLAGGILCQGSQPTIANCLVAGNRALGASGGGGVYCADSEAVFVNCTITGNHAGTGGAGFYSVSSHNMILNSILWADLPREIASPYVPPAAALPTVACTDVQGGFAGQGNLSQDPLFVRPGFWADPQDPNLLTEPNNVQAIWVQGDYRLQGQSPCMDAGDSQYVVGKIEKDLEGDPRVINQRVDMGCDEYNPVSVQRNLTACYEDQCFSLAKHPGAADPERTYIGHTTVFFLMNFQAKLSAAVTAASAAGGTWTGWLVPEVVGPGLCQSELWVRGEDVQIGLLPVQVEDVLLARVKVETELAP
jgi:hypothetical protein